MNKIILFLFIFVNLFNPVSVYLTLLINIILTLVISIKIILTNPIITFFVSLIFAWTLIVVAINSSTETYVVGKYLRAGISAVLISTICHSYKLSIKDLVSVLKVIFFVHILAIGLQLLFPPLDYPMAAIFGFEREANIIESFSIRKLGCSSSYDTAALISVIGLLFYNILYLEKRKNIDLLLSCLSLAACTCSSRTGMLLGLVFFLIFCIALFYKSKGVSRLIPLSIISFGLIVSFYLILPVIAGSTEFLVDIIDLNPDIALNTNEYTQGTVTVLAGGSHFDPLKIPLSDLIIGLGIDPNRIPGRETDIGYIKLIYHIGIIGSTIIFLLYAYFFIESLRKKRRALKTTNEYILSSFVLAYILLLIVMNYKSLEIYSRGCHDLLLIMFCTLNSYKNATTQSV